MSDQIPAYLQTDRPSMAARLLQTLGSPQPPRISIKDNRFTMIDAAGNATPHDSLKLRVIFADVNDNPSKLYREQPQWEANDPTPPDCFSDNGTHASTQAQKPQNAEDNYRCVTCPWNKRGSAISKQSGALIKACRDQQKFAVMLPDQPEAGLFLFTITPGSLGNFRAYLNFVTLHGRDLWMLATELEFDTQGVLKFRAASYIDEALAPKVKEIAEQRLGAQIVNATDQPLLARPSLPPSAAPQDALLAGPLPNYLPASSAPPAPPPASPAPQAAPSTFPEAPKPRGRPKKETVVGPGPIPQEAFANGAASTPASAEDDEKAEFEAFRAAKAAKAAPAPTASSAPPSAPAQTETIAATLSEFGVATAVPADAQLKATLDSLFAPNL